MRSHHTTILVSTLLACTPDTATTKSGTETNSSSMNMSTDGVSQTSNPPTTSGTSEVSTGSSSSSSDPTNFITPPDGGTCLVQDGEVRCSPQCDPWEQDCPEGEKCVPWASGPDGVYDDVRCVPVSRNPQQTGEPCQIMDKIDNCVDEAFCWLGVCTPFCQGTVNEPQCPESSHCVSEGVINLCLPSCDPLTQDCPEGQLCSPNGGEYPEQFVCAPDFSGEEGQAFDPCSQINACDPGLVCIDSSAATECDPEASGCCLPFCDQSQPNTCPGEGLACQPWFDELMIGVCALPE